MKCIKKVTKRADKRMGLDFEKVEIVYKLGTDTKLRWKRGIWDNGRDERRSVG